MPSDRVIRHQNRQENLAQQELRNREYELTIREVLENLRQLPLYMSSDDDLYADANENEVEEIDEQIPRHYNLQDNLNMANQNQRPQVQLPVNLPAGMGDISQEQRAAINNFLAAQVAAAQANVTVSTVNPNIPVPKYKPDVHTAETYLGDIERYFRSMNYRQNNYVQMLPTILSEEQKLWFENTRDNDMTWDIFKQKFTNKYDDWNVTENRSRLLRERQQKDYETVEQFVYEMVRLAKQVNPAEQEKISVLRAKNALVPELRIAIGNIEDFSAEDLIARAATVLRDLKDRDSRNGVTSKLPPLNEHEKRKMNEQRKRNEQSNNDRGNFRGRFNNRGYNNFRGTVNVRQPQPNNTQVQQVQNNVQRQPQNNFRGNYRTPQGAGAGPRGLFRGNMRGRGRANTSQYPQRDKKDHQCRICKNFGHWERECHSPVAMSALGEEQRQHFDSEADAHQEFDQQQQGSSTGMQQQNSGNQQVLYADLNFGGRDRNSPNPSYSQS